MAVPAPHHAFLRSQHPPKPASLHPPPPPPPPPSEPRVGPSQQLSPPPSCRTFARATTVASASADQFLSSKSKLEEDNWVRVGMGLILSRIANILRGLQVSGVYWDGAVCCVLCACPSAIEYVLAAEKRLVCCWCLRSRVSRRFRMLRYYCYESKKRCVCCEKRCSNINQLSTLRPTN